MGNFFSKKSTKEYQIFFDDNQDILAIVNSEAYFINLNKKFQEKLGFSYDKLYSKKFLDLVHKDDIESTLISMHRLSLGETVLCNNRFITSNGEYIRISWNSWQKGDMIYCIGKDITEEYIIEKQLEEYKELLEKSEDLAIIGSWRRNIKTNEISCTSGLRKIFELNEKENVYEIYLNKIHPEDKESITNIIKECINKKSNFILNHRLIINNKIKYIAGNGQYLVVENEEYVLGVIQDISEQKLIEIDLINSKIKAEKASNMKSSFVANISHEIRTPINGIIGMTNLLKEMVLNNEQKEYIDIISTSSGILLSIINNVLDFSKIESGKMLIEYSNINIEELLNSIKSAFILKINEKQLVLNIYISPNLPKILSLDVLKINQILNNLINNAIKFTDYGSISIIVKKINKKISFEIKDTGIGIKEEIQKKLFQPFTQADNTTTRNFGGTGLGLSICKNLINILNGTITMKSFEEIGTTITFIIPLLELEDIKNEELEIEKIESENNEEKMIIVVEDNKINQIVIKKSLEKLQYNNYKIYNNGKHFLEQLSDFKSIDLILMDLHMPIIDGYTCTKEIRKLGYNIPIIALTANAMCGEKEKCIEIGMNDFILKPMQLYDFKAILEKWIN